MKTEIQATKSEIGKSNFIIKFLIWFFKGHFQESSKTIHRMGGRVYFKNSEQLNNKKQPNLKLTGGLQ